MWYHITILCLSYRLDFLFEKRNFVFFPLFFF
nr:MAG TPA: hypothetical protein [Caudoviricetes sp.]DAW76976.1 MAG TPA: hypothetical protein [Caudoviricetes sp.]